MYDYNGFMSAEILAAIEELQLLLGQAQIGAKLIYIRVLSQVVFRYVEARHYRHLLVRDQLRSSLLADLLIAHLLEYG